MILAGGWARVMKRERTESEMGVCVVNGNNRSKEKDATAYRNKIMTNHFRPIPIYNITLHHSHTFRFDEYRIANYFGGCSPDAIHSESNTFCYMRSIVLSTHNEWCTEVNINGTDMK